MKRFAKINWWLIVVVVALMLTPAAGGVERAYAQDSAKVAKLKKRIERTDDKLADAEDQRPDDGEIIAHAMAGAWFEALSLTSDQEDADSDIWRYKRRLERLRRELAEASKGCFLPETKVLMADGTYLEISRLKDGDMVKSFNVKEGRVEAKRVLGAFTYKDYSKSHYLINGALRVTARHRFLMAGPGETWKRTYKLEVGDRVRSMGDDVVIRSIEKVIQENTVHNFIVSDSENYFVSDGKGHYLVHNGGK